MTILPPPWPRPLASRAAAFIIAYILLPTGHSDGNKTGKEGERKRKKGSNTSTREDRQASEQEALSPAVKATQWFECPVHTFLFLPALLLLLLFYPICAKE